MAAHSGAISARSLPNGWTFDQDVEPADGLMWANNDVATGYFTPNPDGDGTGWVWDGAWSKWIPCKYISPVPRETDKDIKVVRVVDITNGDPVLVPTPEAVEADLRAWWETNSDHDLESTIPKAIEYGSESMIEYGRTLARVAGRKVSEAEALEWAIFAYIVGKVGRWTAAVQRGEKVSEDTLKDIEIYAKMARKVRQTGTWT